MGAAGTMDLPCISRARTGGSFSFHVELAWITLALMLFCGATLEGAAQGKQHVTYMETTYGVRAAAN